MVHDYNSPLYQLEEGVHLLVGVVGLHGVPVDEVWPVGVDQGAECLARVILMLFFTGRAFIVIRHTLKLVMKFAFDLKKPRK